MNLGYARVSTREQDTALQIAALRGADVTAYWEEKESGVQARPELEQLLTFLQPGDVLVVYKADRLARSLIDLIRIVDQVTAAGAQLKSLTEPIETVTAIGRLLFQIIGAFAEFERNVIRERCDAGRESAKRRGVQFGRKRQLDYAKAFRMRNLGHTFQEIADEIGTTKSHAVHIVSKMHRELAERIAPHPTTNAPPRPQLPNPSIHRLSSLTTT